MGIIKSGPLLGMSGTVDGLTYSPQPNGTTIVKRKNKASTLPLTEAQESVKADTTIFNDAMKPLLDVINFGYQSEAKKYKISPWNTMVKLVRKNSIQGEYPNRYVDYSRILMFKGNLPSATEISVSVAETGLDFQWNNNVPEQGHYSDHVIMLAYFPSLSEARYIFSGALRTAGKDHLPLQGIYNGHTAHVYIAFGTGDHKGISDSIYLGQFNW